MKTQRRVLRQPIVPPKKNGTHVKRRKVGWGGRIIRPEDGPHPFGAGHGALKRATAQTDRPRCGATDITGPYTESPRPLSCRHAKNAKARRSAGFAFLAGVAGFEPTNGGIKTR